MNTATPHSHTGSNGVYAVVEALYGYFGTLTGHTGNLTDGYQTIGNLRNLSLKESLQEHRACTREYNLRIIVLVVHTGNDGTYGLALAVLVAVYLFRLGKYQLVVLVVDDENLALPYLIYLARNHLTHTVLVLVVQRVVLQLKNFRCKSLTERQDSPTAKLGKVYPLADILVNLIVLSYLTCLSKAYLLVLVGHFSIGHNNTVAVNLEVALIRVNNDIKVLVTTENLGQHVAETLLKHTHERGAVDVLGLLKFPERVDHAHC